MAKLFLSPCGTSLLTNSFTHQEASNVTELDHFVTLTTDDQLRQFITKTANCTEDEIKAQYPEQFVEFAKFIENRQKRLLSPDTTLAEIKKMSAELNTLITYYEGVLPKNGADQHYLLCTDTYQGCKTAEMVKNWLEQQKIRAEIHPMQGLKTDSNEYFQAAMSDVVNWCDVVIKPWHATAGNQIIFNLTGGFKSVQGFLQTIGMFYADEILYIFQSSKELLKIPRLPIDLDASIRQEVANNLRTFRLLAISKQLPASQCENNISETLLFRLNDQVVLSTWGELVWNKLKVDFYQKELLPPLNPDKLVYSDKFTKSIKNITGKHLETLNERLDDLSRHLEDKSSNLSSLDFKKLKGKPLKDSTHELHVWSDQGKRIYGHFEGDKFMIDQLGEHL